MQYEWLADGVEAKEEEFKMELKEAQKAQKKANTEILKKFCHQPAKGE
jgi:hypothetical protein